MMIGAEQFWIKPNMNMILMGTLMIMVITNMLIFGIF